MARVMVAMSGGVDSSLTAALLQEQGHTVIGGTMVLWQGDDKGNDRNDSPHDTADAGNDVARVCNKLNIPFHVYDERESFRQRVVDYFINAYAHGFTPNPCIACNQWLKFGRLLEHARAEECEYLATGHYARVIPPSANANPAYYCLARGIDKRRDQSYVLSMLQQDELRHVLLPLGALTKAEVREEAARRGLQSAHRPESQDICFIPDQDYRGFLEAHAPDIFTPGPILDQDGRQIGQHEGLPRYTVGQRKGLNITVPERRFVTEIDAPRNALIVGTEEAIYRKTCIVEHVSFVQGKPPASSFSCSVQVRAHALPAAATATLLDTSLEANRKVRVTFVEPQRAITPGQTAAFYDSDDGDMVIAGGRIVPRCEDEE